MRLHVGLLIAAVIVVSSCGGTLEDADEIGNSAGDVMSSFDEAGQGGAFAMVVPMIKSGPLTQPGVLDEMMNAIIPSAEAGSCFVDTFDACNNGVRTKSFGSCNILSASLDGNVTLTFSQPDCSMDQVGDSVTRTADFTLTGARAASLAVTSPNGGQKITRTADGFTYTVLGMERVGKDRSGTTQFDISTSTLSDITVSGTRRANRVMTGGSLQIKHNLADYTTVISPNQVTWDGTCNCAVSGNFTGTVTQASGKSDDFSIDITGCGTATITTAKSVTQLTMDRCGALN